MCRGNSHLRLQVREQGWLIAIGALKGGETSSRTKQCVVGILHPDEALAPCSRVSGDETAQPCFQLLVEPLSLAVGLGVVPGAETDSGPNQLTKSLPELGDELRSSIRNHIPGKTMLSEHETKLPLPFPWQRDEVHHL